MDAQSKRASGRTHRMMLEAINLAQNGRAVYVVCHTMAHANYLHREWADKTQGLGIKFETTETLGPSWSWETMKSLGMHPNCVVLVDNWAIEGRFSAMLEMLTRWDNP